MQKFMRAIAAIMLTVAVVIAAGCNKQENNNVKVTTHAPQDITATTATISGEVDVVTSGISITEKGVCWGTSKNPTVSDNHMASNGRGVNVTCTITGLEPSTNYHVRVYATDGTEFYYGTDQGFTTLESGGGGNDGALNGVFSISATERVHFSQGNLQYQASTNTWRFADNQYDYMARNNLNISATNSGWIDLFGWGTSGWNNGNDYYQPYDFEYVPYHDGGSEIGCGYGPTDGTDYTYDLTGAYANADWGVYNSISNGGNQAGIWRTLTYEEWLYVFLRRNTASGITFVKAEVAGVNGVILLPDDWTRNVYVLYSGSSYETNVISMDAWENILEAHGAVFLPAAGNRDGTSVSYAGSYGYYWSASHHVKPAAWQVNFTDSFIDFSNNYDIRRYYGHSVRLVCPAN